MTREHPSPFGALLRHHRVVAGLTQEELAERAGISLRGLVALENGERLRPRRDTVQLLADALQLASDARLQFEDAARRRDATSLDGEAGGPSEPPVDRRQGVDVQPARRPLPPLLGRARELELLEWHLAGLGPPLLAFAGEPGIGKTRLLRAAGEVAGRRGLAVISGGCQRRSGQEPFAPFPRAIRRHLADLPHSTQVELVRANHWLVRLLPELSPLLPEPVTPALLNADQERRLLFDAVVDLLATLAGDEGALLILDDLQWAPNDALDLLTALAHDAVDHRVRIVCAYRSTEVRPADPLTLMLADLAHAELLRQTLVEGLSLRESEQMLTALAADLHPTSATVQQAVARTGGVPFYLVSYAQELRTQGAAPTSDVPWDVAHSIQQRAAILPEASQEVLHFAAVAGRVVSLSVLERATGRKEMEILSALEAACRARLLEEAEQPVYRFPHDVIRETIEDHLGTARRAVLHRKLGEALEQLAPGVRSGGPAELAWHFKEAGNWERALHYNLRAGDEAAAVFAHGEAEQHYGTAVNEAREVGDPVREAEALEKLGWILWTVGRYHEALGALDQAGEMQHRAGNIAAEGQIAAKIGWALSQAGKPEEGIARLQTLTERLEEEGPSPALVELYAALVHLFVRQGRAREMVTAAERASELAQMAGDDRLLVQGELNREMALYALDRFDDALHVLENLIPMAERIGDSETLARALIHAAEICAAQGEFVRSRTYRERVLDLRERTSSPDRVANALALLGDLLLLQGDWEHARVRYGRAAEMTSALASHQAGWVRLSLARLCLIEGKCQDAATYMEESRSVVERTGDRESVPRLEALLAERDLLQGRAGAAAARLEPLVDEFDLDYDVMVVLAEGYVDIGNTVRAEEVITRGVDRAVAQNNRLALAEWKLVQGMLLARQGHGEEAERALEETVSLSSAVPYTSARALYEWGGVCLERGAAGEARKRMEEALLVFRRLGASPYADRAESALRTLGRHRSGA